MARLLVEPACFADPAIGSDGWGVMHAQWRITGNGLLVMSFLGYGEILLTAGGIACTGNSRFPLSLKSFRVSSKRQFASSTAGI